MSLIPYFTEMELGAYGPQVNGRSLTGYFTFDGRIPFGNPAKEDRRRLTEAFFGYTRFWSTANALDYGPTTYHLFPEKSQNKSGLAVFVDLRDYRMFRSPVEHSFVVPLGLCRRVSMSPSG